MVFVYQGSGKIQKEGADVCQRACKKFACDIQWCLSRNNYQQHKCENFVQKWNDCCEKAKKREITSKNK